MTQAQVEVAGLAMELNGINVIAENERKGKPSDLFWPWCAANISVLAIAYGSYVVGFGVSFWQATIAGVIGVVLSFALCGAVALAGKRGSAPTMVLSRAAFGVQGNALPSALSWILLVGWETVLVSLSSLATATVFEELGWGGGNATKVLGFVVTAVLVVGAGVLGFDVIMRLQTWITYATIVLTIGFIALTLDEIHWSALSDKPSGSMQAFIGALALVATGFGVGWANTAADYSRYLPRKSSSWGVFGWTTFGGAVAPLVLIVYGIAMASSGDKLAGSISDPIGTLTTLLPTWYLVPFAIVAVLGLVGGAVLDIYSSGLALLTLGLKVRRPVAAAADGVIMMIGAIYVVFIADDFLGPFQAFLITVGVPIAAWAGVFVADLALRRQDYADAELYDARGRYGSIGWIAVLSVVIGTVLGWGLVTTTSPSTSWLSWQGYLLEPFGMGSKVDGAWVYANVGVFVAFAVGFLGWFLLGRSTVARQEAAPGAP